MGERPAPDQQPETGYFGDGVFVRALRIIRWVWPGWWLYAWYVPRFVGHDCDENRVICRLDFLLRCSWGLDR